MRNKTYEIISYTILGLLGLIYIYPFYILIVNTFKPETSQQVKSILQNPLALPTKWDLTYIKIAIDKIDFFQSFIVSLIITIVSVSLVTLISSMTAWMLVRVKSKVSTVIFFLFVSAMLIPFQAVMFPLLNVMDALFLKNLPGLIFMYVGFGISLSVFLYHGFIKSIPMALEEAAIIDGANIFQTFFKVVFPLLKPITVTVIILNTMWIWNDFLLPFLVIGNSPIKTLPLALYFARITSGQYGSPWELLFSSVFISIIPVVLLYFTLQRFIVEGIAEGSIK